MPYGKFSRQTYNGTISLVNSPKPSTQLNSSRLRSGISWFIRPCLSFDSGSHYPLQALATNTGIGTPALQVQQVSHSIRGCSFRYHKASTVSFWRRERDSNPRTPLITRSAVFKTAAISQTLPSRHKYRLRSRSPHILAFYFMRHICSSQPKCLSFTLPFLYTALPQSHILRTQCVIGGSLTTELKSM